MKQLTSRLLGWLLLAPAILPLVYVNGLLYPFVAPKTLLFRAFGIVVLAAFFYLAFSGRELFWNRLRNKLAWIPAALLVVAYAMSLLGVDFYHSFWSVYDRGDGLLTLTTAVVFFYAALLYADRNFLPKLFKIVAWVATAVSAYVVVQWLGEASGINFSLIEEARGRVGGTLGNAAFLAGYLGMTLWATLAIAGESRGFWKKAYYGGAALQFLAIVLAATRGTMLALLVVGFVALVYLALRGDPSTKLGVKGGTRNYARIALAALIICAGLFFVFRAPLSTSSFEPVRRVASVSLADATVSSRVFIWQHTWSEAVKKPLTGYGAENIEMIFDRVYDPGAIIEQWFDRTHNAFLDYFVQFGILGALLYAGLIGALGYVGLALWRTKDPIRESTSNGASRYGVFLLLLACTYAIQNFFVFDTAMTLWLLFATLAAALAYVGAQDAARKESSSALSLRIPQAVSYGAAAAILVLLYPVSIQPLRANLLLAQGYTYHVTDVARAISDFEKGLLLGTYADVEYGYQAYTMYTDNQQVMLAGEARVAAYRYALGTLTKNFERYPYDARTATYLAHVLDSAPDGEPVDEAFLRSVLVRAIELSPKRAQANYILANIPLKKGDVSQQPAERNRYYKEAIGLLEEYAARVPNFAEPRFIIASLYVVIGDPASGKRWADEGLPLYRGGTDVARKALRYYIAVEDWPNVRRFLSDIVKDNPIDYPILYDLAKAELLTGNRERALQIVQELRLKAPGLVETDPVFLKSLGT